MTAPQSTSWASEGRLTREAIDEYRLRIGKKFPTEPRGRLRHISPDAIKVYALAIGDDRPFWVDAEQAGHSRWNGLVAPPSIVFAVFLGEVMSGLRGVHAFHGGGAWEFFKPIRSGDTISAECTFVDVEEKSSEFSPLWLVAYYESVYRNQTGEIVAKVLSHQIRVERRTMRSSGTKSKRVVPHVWTDAERERIEQEMVRQQVRGSVTRFFEDVSVGEELPALVKGPMRQTDLIGWLAATETFRSTNAGLKEISRHPGLGLLTTASNARESIESVHWDNDAARSAGMPGAYDLGAQRHAYMMQSITDWMGDDGFLKKNACAYRGFVFLGDALWFGGKVTKKYVDENGESCVDIESKTLNQHSEDVMPSTSTVILPSRERGTHPADRRGR